MPGTKLLLAVVFLRLFEGAEESAAELGSSVLKEWNYHALWSEAQRFRTRVRLQGTWYGRVVPQVGRTNVLERKSCQVCWAVSAKVKAVSS